MTWGWVFWLFSSNPASKCSYFRSSHQRCSAKKAVLKNFSIFAGKYLCWSLIIIAGLYRPITLLKRESSTGFSCEYCEIFKSTYFKEQRWRLLFFSSYSPSALSFLLAACPISKIIFMQIYLAFKTYEFFHFCRLVFSRFLN